MAADRGFTRHRRAHED
ncbi:MULTISPECIES: hypothetical protein [Sphingomonadaceae]|nr:hypothetical protein [Hephaestia caeni]